MEEPLFSVAVVTNGKKTIPALIDSGSSPYAIMNEAFVREHGDCFDIKPRNLGGVGGATVVRRICYFSLDIDGHRQDRVFRLRRSKFPPIRYTRAAIDTKEGCGLPAYKGYVR